MLSMQNKNYCTPAQQWYSYCTQFTSFTKPVRHNLQERVHRIHPAFAHPSTTRGLFSQCWWWPLQRQMISQYHRLRKEWEKWQWCVSIGKSIYQSSQWVGSLGTRLVHICSIAPMPSLAPVFDHLQYAKMEPESWFYHVIHDTGDVTDSRHEDILTFISDKFQSRDKSYL